MGKLEGRTGLVWVLNGSMLRDVEVLLYVLSRLVRLTEYGGEDGMG